MRTYELRSQKPRPDAVTFHESLHCSVHAVVEVLQHEDNLVVAPVGDDRPHRADLEGRSRVTCKSPRSLQQPFCRQSETRNR